MKTEEIYTTQTIQPSSCALFEANGILTKDRQETEDNRRLMLAVFDSLNKLNEKLSRLNYLIERKRIEQILYQK